MRATSLKISIMSEEDAASFVRIVEEKLAEAHAGKRVRPHRDLVFPNLEVLRSVLTVERLALLKLIRRSKPGSVYALAKLAGRDRASVTQDLGVLVELGLVRLTRTKGPGRARTVPHVDYDRIDIGVDV